MIKIVAKSGMEVFERTVALQEWREFLENVVEKERYLPEALAAYATAFNHCEIPISLFYNLRHTLSWKEENVAEKLGFDFRTVWFRWKKKSGSK